MDEIERRIFDLRQTLAEAEYTLAPRNLEIYKKKRRVLLDIVEVSLRDLRAKIEAVELTLDEENRANG